MFNIAALLRLLGQQQQAPQMPAIPQRSGSAGMFDQYMSGLFNQRYAPPVMPNTPSSVQPMGGAFGFMPNLPSLPNPPVAPAKAGQTPAADPQGTTMADIFRRNWQRKGS